MYKLYYCDRVITTLIGDTINDHLFETQTVTTTIPSNSSSKHVHTVASGGLGVATSPSITSSSSFQFNGDVRSDSSTEGTGMRPAGTSTDGSTGLRSGSSTESRSGTDGTRLRSGSSTEDIAEHQTSRVKQLQKDLDLSSVVKRSSASRGSRYRKSAVYGETIVTNTEGQDDGGSNRGGVSVLARQLEGKMKGIDVKQQDEKGDGATPESLIEVCCTCVHSNMYIEFALLQFIIYFIHYIVTCKCSHVLIGTCALQVHACTLYTVHGYMYSM